MKQVARQNLARVPGLLLQECTFVVQNELANIIPVIAGPIDRAKVMRSAPSFLHFCVSGQSHIKRLRCDTNPLQVLNEIKAHNIVRER